jgi:hypothetical protein
VYLAAAGGSLAIVKLLLDRGNMDGSCESYNPTPPAIVSAIVLENTEMFHFLRDRGAAFGSDVTGEAVGRAKDAGLDSMLELLAAEGVDVARFPPIAPQTRIHPEADKD